MSPRWNWDFEDRRKASQRSSRSSPAQQARRVQVRRRRGVGAVALVIVFALVLAVLASGSRHPRPAARARTQPMTGHVRASPPLPEDDQNAAVSSVLGYTPFVKEGSSRAREIALTFDDGPGPYTPAVLDVLERFHVHATFFEIGEMLRYFSASTLRELRDGDAIGDHTETHAEMARLPAHDQREELFEQIARIELLGGPRPLLFRPPYGSYDATTIRELHELHLLMVLWSVDTEDYLQPGVSAIVQRALAGAHPGAIILMHDAGGTRTQTIAALPIIISRLLAQGYRLVTVPQLLHDDPPPPGQTLPSSLRGD
jgi:peptidoglycan/xylan/chitin deacetylase (PgdA/CDA1 family)